MKATLATSFLATTVFMAVGCTSQDTMDNPTPTQPNAVGVSTPAPNADPNNPGLTHKGVSQTGGDPSASGTSQNGNNH